MILMGILGYSKKTGFMAGLTVINAKKDLVYWNLFQLFPFLF